MRKVSERWWKYIRMTYMSKSETWNEKVRMETKLRLNNQWECNRWDQSNKRYIEQSNTCTAHSFSNNPRFYQSKSPFVDTGAVSTILNLYSSTLLLNLSGQEHNQAIRQHSRKGQDNNSFGWLLCVCFCAALCLCSVGGAFVRQNGARVMSFLCGMH